MQELICTIVTLVFLGISFIIFIRRYRLHSQLAERLKNDPLLRPVFDIQRSGAERLCRLDPTPRCAAPDR